MKINIQMEGFGVQFDYKQDRRCILLYYAVKTTVAILLSISTMIIYTSVRANYSTLNVLNYLGPHIFQYLIMFNISTTYLTLVRCLRQRFSKLNSLLRWSWFCHYFNILPINWFFFVDNFLYIKRKQFPIENELPSVHKNESVKFIKCIGQQHGFLTDIMDLINVCYSFQVTSWFWSCQETHNYSILCDICDTKWKALILDNGYLWRHIYSRRFDMLHILSIHVRPNGILQRFVSHSYHLDHIFLCVDASSHTLWKCISTRGKFVFINVVELN